MNKETKIDIVKLRKQCFNKNYELDQNLISIVENSPSNKFLTNPPIQNIYLYLVELVCQFSEKWLQKDMSQIKVLDWGAGKGHISYFLKNKKADLKSCDILDADAHDSTFGQDTPIIDKYHFKIDPLEHPYKLPYADETFDIVLSFGVLEHVPNDEKSIIEISRILKKNGLFFCFHLPQPLSWTQKIQHLKGNYYHDRFYDKETIQKLSNFAELEVLDIWHRALLPKNTINYPFYRSFEKLDLFFTEYTFLKYFATNIEFIATKK